MHINDLPREILKEVLSYLTLKEKFQCELVCHHWQKIVFTSVRSLIFEYFEDVYYGHHEHYASNEKPLRHLINLNDEAMKHIVSKCGSHIRSFKGFVSFGTMQIIVQHCKRLHCADMLFDNIKSFKMLQDTFLAQLTCVTVYTHLQPNISSFMLQCSKLTSLAVITTRFPVPVESISSSDCMLLLEEPALSQSFASLKNLVIEEHVTWETVKRLALLPKLEMVSIYLEDDLNQSALWQEVMTSWSTLKSLSLKLNSENCMSFDPLPPNLEFLSLEIIREYMVHYEKSRPIQFSSCVSKLKRLMIGQLHMTPFNLNTSLKSMICCCPSLEELSLGCYRILYDVDVLLEPLFSLTALKKVSLGHEFKITDVFAARLITDLENLTSMGSFEECPNIYWESLIPGGPIFWQALRKKAKSHPSDSFNFVGILNERLHLQDPLPPNISLYLKQAATVELSNGFGKSIQWQELSVQCYQLRVLNIDIQDSNLFLIGIPDSVEILNIRCLKYAKCEDLNALGNNTVLPNLKDLIIYQSFMTNRQLEATVKCIAKCCPKVERLCIDRDNFDDESVDEYLIWMLNYKFLSCLCMTERFGISNIFGSSLIREVKTLKEFGCYVHLHAFHCSASLLNTLDTEFAKKERNEKRKARKARKSLKILH